MRPAQMLDHKADLIARMTNPVVRQAWTAQIAEDTAASSGLTDVQSKANGAASIYALGIAAREAACYHVRPEMSALTVFAASQLNVTDRIDRRLAPTRYGLVRFEEALPFQDVRGQMLKVSWMVWGPVIVQANHRHDKGEPFDAMAIWMFNDHYDQPDEIFAAMASNFTGQDIEQISRTLGRWGLIGTELLMEGQRLGPAMVSPNDNKTADLLADGTMPHEFTNPVRLVHALWLLLNQSVTLTQDADIDRQTAKRARRMGIPDRVTVIQLRRAAGHTEGDSDVEWDHRWVVRGHWRNQPVSEHHPQAQQADDGSYYARIWIAPYVKGPDGKPLVITDKVYALHR